MSTRSRLDQLRRQTGGLKATKCCGNLTKRLSRMQLKAKKAVLQSSALSETELAVRLGGQLIEEGVVLVEERLPLASLHGNLTLSSLTREKLSLPSAENCNPSDLLFMDTETTGLSGGSGTLVFLLGVARIVEGYLVLRQYLLTSFSGEAALLASCSDWLSGEEMLVTYNGKSFDVPLLATRSRMTGMPDRFSGLPHLDLLHPVRRAFKSCWPNCRLAAAEERVIGFRRINDLSGAEAPAAWFEWIRQQQVKGITGVLKHNRWDLISLAALLPQMARVYRSPGEWGADISAIACGWQKTGDETLAFEILRWAQTELTDEGLKELARLWRRKGEWDQACRIWSRLAARGDAEATEFLAKYHEHVAKDFAAALKLSCRLPDGEAARKRYRRLTAKLASATQNQLCIETAVKVHPA